jgi:hypothetical protein
VLPPRPLLALCVLLVGALAWSVAVRPPPDVPLADAERWEGQTVRVEGWAQDIRPGPRFTLVDGGRALDVRTPQIDAHRLPGIGDWVRAEGRLSRWDGALVLDVDAADADALRVTAGPRPVQLGWSELAEPGHWRGTLLRLAGRVEDGRLRGDGASIALGDGPWPASGRVVATGLLRFDPTCVCHRLDAREVRPSGP